MTSVFQHLTRIGFALLFAQGLNGCGGGGGSGSTTPAPSSSSPSSSIASSVSTSSTASSISSSSTVSSISSSLASSSATSSIASGARTEAPFFLSVADEDGAVTVSWFDVEGAEKYDIYYALETGVTPDNHATLDGGNALLNVTSPVTISGLVNGHLYYLVVVASSQAGGESEPSFELMGSPAGPTPRYGSGLLNDTGMDLCGGETGSNNLPCPVDGFSGQDGDHGRDAQARAGNLTKIGGGVAGFDFTKLNSGGTPLAASATSWTCVRDNHTELVWWINKGGSYSWYDPDNTTNGGDAGTQNGGICTGSSCDTHALIQHANNVAPCGFTDWRLPTRLELMGIMHNGYMVVDSYGNGFDTDYFPEVWALWTSQTDARVTHGAWIISFRPNYQNHASKSGHLDTWLVRGNQ